MPDFIPLSDFQEKQLRITEAFQERYRELMSSYLAARGTIRVGSVIVKNLDPLKPDEVAIIGDTMSEISSAYSSLEHIIPAMDYSRERVRLALLMFDSSGNNDA